MSNILSAALLGLVFLGIAKPTVADIGINISQSPTNPVELDSTIEYTIRLTPDQFVNTDTDVFIFGDDLEIVSTGGADSCVFETSDEIWICSYGDKVLTSNSSIESPYFGSEVVRPPIAITARTTASETGASVVGASVEGRFYACEFNCTFGDSSQLTTEVSQAPLPDLVIESLTHSPEEPTISDNIVFTATVMNVGDATATASTVALRVGGESNPATFTVPSLAPGQEFSVERELQLGVAQNYRNTATADFNQLVNESDESNNVRTDDYTVVDVDEQPPVANAGADRSVRDTDNDRSETVALDASESSDPDGQIVSYQWLEGGQVIATGESATAELGIGAHTITLRVTDDDGLTDDDTVVIEVVEVAVAGSIEFSAATYTVSESDNAVTVMARRVGGTDGPLTVSYSTRDGTAIRSVFGEGDSVDGDYDPAQGILTWADGDDEAQPIRITINSDDEVEGSEEFFVDLDNDESTRVIITDVPPPNRGMVEFAPVSYTVMESDGEVTISATRRQGSAGAITVLVSTVNGTAVAGSDFSAGGPQRLTWTNGDTASKSLTIPLIVDNISEPPERFTVRMTLANEQDIGEGLLGSASTATVNIVEPELDPGTLQFSASSYRASETAGEVELTVTRAGGSNGALTASVSTSDGSADAGDDYESTQAVLRWDDGDLESQTISVPILQDTFEEPSETFIATLSVPTGQDPDTLGTPSVATVTISDVAPPRNRGTVQFTSATASVAEDDGALRLQVSRTGGQDDAISMSVQVTNGSATSGLDFQFEPDTVRWVDQDDGLREVVIPIELDNLAETAETFRVTLVATAANAEALGTPATVTVTIRDVSNPLLAGTLSLAQPGYTVSEALGSVTLAVNRTGGSEGAVSVQYDTVAGSAISPDDFTAASGRLSWENGDATPKELILNVTPDALVEDDEQFEVTLSDPVGPDNASLSLGRASSSVTIQDSTNVGQLQFSSDIYSGSEADGRVDFSVERVGGSDGPVSVGYRLQSGTATAGDDYIGVSGTLNWADGDESPKNAAIRLLTDDLVEPLETFEIILSNAQPLGVEQITLGVAAVQIVDSTTFTTTGPLAPFLLTIVSGDNQSFIPGDDLDPLVLQASIEAPATDSVEELTINWRVEPAGSAELLDGIQTTTDADGLASNQVRVLDRGFVRVLARVGQRLQPEPSAPGSITGRIAPPPVDMVEGEIAFTLRSGLFAAEGLNNNQAQTGSAMDAACVALDQQSDPQSDDPMALTTAQQDLQATCRSLESRLEDGTLTAALDRLAPEELFTLGDSVIDSTELQITNVYSRINAIRRGRSDGVDVSGLSMDVRGELIPGSVVEAAQNTLPSGGAASADEGTGYSPRFGVFANGSLSVGEVDGDDNQRNADISTTGLTIGMDYRLSANSAVGIGLGIANNQTEFTGDEGRVDLSAVNLSLFATYFEENSGYVDVVLDAGRNQFDIERRIDLPGSERRIANGSTDANVLALTLGAGFDKNYGTFEFGPYGRFSVVNASVDAYRETADSDGVGSGSVLAIDSHSVRSTTVSIGAQASRPISTRTGVFVPQVNIEGEVELTDSKDGITATFQHDPSQSAFEINGNERDTSYLNIGLGSSFLLANGRSGYVFYETRAQHDFVTQHWLRLGIRLEFR